MKVLLSILVLFVCSLGAAQQTPGDYHPAPIAEADSGAPQTTHGIKHLLWEENDPAAARVYRGLEIQTGAGDTISFQSVPGPTGGSVRGIARDSSGWLYAATDGGVYRSMDNGQSWELRPFPSLLYNFVEPVTVLGPGVIVAETDWSNYISTDRGNSWRYLYEDVQGFAVDTNGVIYAGSDAGGVKRSVDTARSWTPFALAGKKIWRVVLCGGGQFACLSDSGVFLSADGGTTWTLRPFSGIFSWNLTSDQKGHLFSISNWHFYRSSDFGASWQQLSLPTAGDAYRVYTEGRERIIVVTHTDIITSADAGETWISLGAPPGTALSVGRDASGNLLAGSLNGLYRRDATSGAWHELSNGMHARDIRAMAFTSAGSILIYTPWECLRSSDNGATWSKVVLDSAVSGYPPLFSSRSGSIFMAGSSGLLRSTDDGVTWKVIPIPSNSYAIYAITEGASGDLLAGSGRGDIYRSTDNGNSWSRVASGATQYQFWCMASDSQGNHYAARDTSILLSRDGIAWETIPLRRNYSSWESMAVDARGHVYLGSSSNGVYRSSDQGRTWKQMNDGVLDRYVMSIATDDSGNVVLGTSSGVYRLADSVDSWLRFGSGFPSTFVKSLAFSPDGFLLGGTQSYGIYRSVRPVGRRVPSPAPPPPGPGEFSLLQNFPNPFNGTTRIRYTVPQLARVEIKIYNVLGQVVTTLVSGVMSAGSYTAEWNPSHLASGVYFSVMKGAAASSAFRKTIKLLYLR